MKDVTFEAAEYQAFKERAMLVTDVVENTVKTSENKKLYLPPPNPHDQTERNKLRYKQYLLRAILTNFAGNTQRIMVGAAFRVEPEVELPGGVDFIEADADAGGVTLQQQARSTLGHVITKGRHGLLVDYPPVDGAMTRAQLAAKNIRPFICSIDALRIINWRVEPIDGEYKLSLVVYREDARQPGADGFSEDVVEQYRVLLLDAVDGGARVYRQRLYRKTDTGWQQYGNDITPRKGDGSTWSRIPFVFVGAENNDPTVDASPLYDLATVNIGHYRNSADYEDSAYMVGQPQYWASGIDEHYFNMLKKEGIYCGSRELFPVPEGGELGIAQPEPNTMCREAMQDKERQMAAMGARMLTPGSAPKTATEAEGDQANEHSILSLAVNNVSQAYRWCIQQCGLFQNVDAEDVTFAISTEFTRVRLNPQMFAALHAALMSGDYPRSDWWQQLRKTGLIDSEKEDEDIEDEIEIDAPDSLDLGQDLTDAE